MIDARLEQARAAQRGYTPNAEVQDYLRRVTLIPMIGASAMGKNFLMEASGEFIAGTLTTRAPRDDDNPAKYTYMTNDEALEAIARRELVQYAVNTHAGTIYGSQMHDYTTTGPVLMDTLSSAVRDLENKGFGAVRPVSVITPIDQWQRQFIARCQGQPAAFALARLREAEQSIDWTTEQYLTGTPNHIILKNTRDMYDIAHNIQYIKQHARGESVPQPSISEINRYHDDLLIAIGELLVKYST